ncbi:hypothetical protein D3H55_10150 [Bacillus salacetis]|uniref:Uncharacterized protein n=1 Tax=Bacillus salacetis TaxID=2315464 RepID=A0A3A1R301_9BACI|nr:hypothetical protein D3H55_10150 [Bacillus salacetis]
MRHLRRQPFEKPVSIYIVAFEKSQVPDFPLYSQVSLSKKRAATVFPASRDFNGDLPGYYFKLILNSNKVYEKSI